MSQHWTKSGKAPHIAIIGAGMSGIAAVVKLRKAGYSDLTVFEKADRIGGTWRENRYPGLSCDVPSHWYSFTFAPNPDWSHRFSYGPDILAYLEKVARDFDVLPYIRFNSEIKHLSYKDGQWHVTVGDKKPEVFDIVISATGVLHHPVLPDIEGLDSFKGKCFHSSRWPENLSLEGKSVGVIGTGSTAMQLIGEITKKTGAMYVFQRTAQWMVPLPQRAYSKRHKFIFRLFPFLMKALYWQYYFIFRFILAPATLDDKKGQARLSKICDDHLHREITDPDLLAKLTPTYQAGCKRIIIASDFYPAIRRKNAHLITEDIERITPKGVQTKDGKEHKLDVLVLATGFDSSAFILPTKVIGENGVELGDVWGKAPRAHRAVAMPGFPNFWMVEGPTGPVGNLSLIMISEYQVDYIISMLNYMRKHKMASLAPKQEAFQEYNALLTKHVKGTLWATGGCNSWYIDASGLPNLYSLPPQRYLKDMHRPQMNEFETQPA